MLDIRLAMKKICLAQVQILASNLHEARDFNEKFLHHNQDKYHIDWMFTKKNINDTLAVKLDAMMETFSPSFAREVAVSHKFAANQFSWWKLNIYFE